MTIIFYKFNFLFLTNLNKLYCCCNIIVCLYVLRGGNLVDYHGGTYNLEMGTQAGEEASTPTHVFFATDYATTAAARTALYTPAT